MNFFLDNILNFAQNCGHKLEPPEGGGFNEYPQSMFYSKNKKNMIGTLYTLSNSGVERSPLHGRASMMICPRFSSASCSPAHIARKGVAVIFDCWTKCACLVYFSSTIIV